MTVTPVANCPINRRSSFGSVMAGPSSVRGGVMSTRTVAAGKPEPPRSLPWRRERPPDLARERHELVHELDVARRPRSRVVLEPDAHVAAALEGEPGEPAPHDVPADDRHGPWQVRAREHLEIRIERARRRRE